MSGYAYRPLESASETRLVRLEPAENLTDELIGSLIHTTLVSDEPEKYEALSYVWKNSSPLKISEHKMEGSQKIKNYVYLEMTENAPPEDLDIIDFTFDDLKNSDNEWHKSLYYLMGADRPDGYIVCDGQKVTVGGELQDAMRRLRYTDRQRLLWIDALCINQNDIEERNEHVKKMGEIYLKADGVCIWLGEFISDPETVFETIEEIRDIMREVIPAMNIDDKKGIRMRFLSEPRIQNLRWDKLALLLRRAWFSRVWILQETFYAKEATIYAGSSCYEWKVFAAVISWLREYDADLPLNVMGELGPLPGLERTFDGPALNSNYNESELPRLLDTLIETRICTSTLAADKVYGVLGMVCEEDRDRVKADYSLNGAEAFQQIAVDELYRNGLGILGLCTLPKKKSGFVCPSWVPNWTQPCHHKPLSRLGYKSSAGGSTLPEFRIDNKSLILKGRIVDVIEAVELARSIPTSTPVSNPGILSGPKWEGLFSNYLSKSMSEYKEWLSCAMEMAMTIAYDSDKNFNHDIFEALWRTFCCNQTSDGKVPGEEYRGYFSEFVTANVAGVEEANGMHGVGIEKLKERIAKFVGCFGRWCVNRRFVRSRDGRFGWGPDQVRVGDVVCVFNGGAVPFVLRPALTGHFEWGPGEAAPGDLLVVDGVGPERMILRSERAGSYEVVGDAYLHGIMDGEAMGMALEKQEIHLV